MDFEYYKKHLIELGVDKRLVEMPAVTDDLLTQAVLGDLSFEETDKLIEIISPTEIKLQEKKVVLHEDGTASIEEIFGGKVVNKSITDVNGMEVYREEGISQQLLITYERKDGFVVKTDIIKSTGDKIQRVYFDIGACCLNMGCKVSPVDKFGRQVDFNENDVLQRVNRNERIIIMKYPHLKDYFQILRENVKTRIGEEETPKRKQEAEAIEEENLYSECRRLAHELEYADRHLKIGLEFLESIKKHPLGKFIFRKHLKKYSEEIGEVINSNGNADKEDKQEKLESDDEDSVYKSDLDELRDRRKRLAEKLKSIKPRRDIVFKYVGDVIKEPTIKVLSILPIYVRYDKKIREHYTDLILGEKERIR